MEKHIDVMKQSIELIETVVEGLKHIQKLVNEGNFEESILLFEDTVQAYLTVEKSMEGLPENLQSVESKDIGNKAKAAIELVVDAYESKSYGDVQVVLQFTLIPRYNKWRQTLEENLQQYTIS